MLELGRVGVRDRALSEQRGVEGLGELVQVGERLRGSVDRVRELVSARFRALGGQAGAVVLVLVLCPNDAPDDPAE